MHLNFASLELDIFFASSNLLLSFFRSVVGSGVGGTTSLRSGSIESSSVQVFPYSIFLDRTIKESRMFRALSCSLSS